MGLLNFYSAPIPIAGKFLLIFFGPQACEADKYFSEKRDVLIAHRISEYSGDSIYVYLSTIFCGEKTLIRYTVPRIPSEVYFW
jgi:hypothetical protein